MTYTTKGKRVRTKGKSQDNQVQAALEKAHAILGPYSQDEALPGFPTIESRLLIEVALLDQRDHQARKQGKTPGNGVQSDLLLLAMRISELRRAFAVLQEVNR